MVGPAQQYLSHPPDRAKLQYFLSLHPWIVVAFPPRPFDPDTGLNTGAVVKPNIPHSGSGIAGGVPDMS